MIVAAKRGDVEVSPDDLRLIGRALRETLPADQPIRYTLVYRDGRWGEPNTWEDCLYWVRRVRARLPYPFWPILVVPG